MLCNTRDNIGGDTNNVKEKKMVCFKCDQELDEGLKFCTKCGAKFNTWMTSKKITYLSLILPIVGIIGFWVFRQIVIPTFLDSGGFTNDRIRYYNFLIIRSAFIFPIIAGFMLAFLTLYKRSKLIFFVGLIPCIHFFITTLMDMMRVISHLQEYIQRFGG